MQGDEEVFREIDGHVVGPALPLTTVDDSLCIGQAPLPSAARVDINTVLWMTAYIIEDLEYIRVALCTPCMDKGFAFGRNTIPPRNTVLIAASIICSSEHFASLWLRLTILL